MPPASKVPAARFLRRGRNVLVRLPSAEDERAFLAGVAASRRLHASWVRPPGSSTAYRVYVRRYAAQALHAPDATREIGFVACERASGALAGVFNLSEIIRGSLQSAFLGYFAFAGMDGRGYMREALGLVLDLGFGPLGLHRVEVNIQPANERSIALAEGIGFAREGYSPRYVKVAGRWRDHVRYAMLRDRWRTLRRRT